MIESDCIAFDSRFRNEHKCIFPFRYKGRLWSHCTHYDIHGSRNWCSTKVIWLILEQYLVTFKHPGTYQTFPISYNLHFIYRLMRMVSTYLVTLDTVIRTATDIAVSEYSIKINYFEVFSLKKDISLIIIWFLLDSLNLDDEILPSETNKYSNDYATDYDNRDVAFRLVRDEAEKRIMRKGNI